MYGRCKFGFLWMSCTSTGPLTGVLFALMFAGVLSWLVFGVCIYNALQKRHPAEWEHTRLGIFSGYQRYAWQHRGRKLGDDKLTSLLDRYRTLQIATYSLIVLAGLFAYLGF